MKKILSIFLIFAILVSITGIASAGISTATVTRTADKDYLRIGDTGKFITVTLTGSSGVIDSGLTAWGAVESISTGAKIIITPVTEASNVVKTTDETTDSYSFATISGALPAVPILEYKITLDTGATIGTFSLTGTFIDSNKNTGTISSTTINNIRILPVCTPSDDPVCYYDTNVTPGIQRDELINAIHEYFDGPLTLINVLKVVRAYLGLPI